MDGYLQDRRLLQIDTVLEKDHVLLVSITGVDRISAFYTYELELASTDPDLKPDDLLGSAVTIHFRPEDGQDAISIDGIVSRFASAGHGKHDICLYRAELVPSLWC